jgi:hypothetical protein
MNAVVIVSSEMFGSYPCVEGILNCNARNLSLSAIIMPWPIVFPDFASGTMSVFPNSSLTISHLLSRASELSIPGHNRISRHYTSQMICRTPFAPLHGRQLRETAKEMRFELNVNLSTLPLAKVQSQHFPPGVSTLLTS